MFMAVVLIVDMVKHRRPTLLDVERFTFCTPRNIFFYLCEGAVDSCFRSGDACFLLSCQLLLEFMCPIDTFVVIVNLFTFSFL